MRRGSSQFCPNRRSWCPVDQLFVPCPIKSRYDSTASTVCSIRQNAVTALRPAPSRTHAPPYPSNRSPGYEIPADAPNPASFLHRGPFHFVLPLVLPSPSRTHGLRPSIKHSQTSPNRYHSTTGMKTHHAQTHPLVLIHNITQNLARSSDRDALLVAELVQAALHAEVCLPVTSQLEALRELNADSSEIAAT